MRDELPQEETPARDPAGDLRRMDIRHVALIAFVVGVLFHACVVFAVLDDGGSSPEPGSPDAAPVTQQRTPTAPTVPPDRTNCAEIRGSDYRSETERRWFQQNCSTGLGNESNRASELSAT